MIREVLAKAPHKEHCMALLHPPSHWGNRTMLQSAPTLGLVTHMVQFKGDQQISKATLHAAARWLL